MQTTFFSSDDFISVSWLNVLYRWDFLYEHQNTIGLCGKFLACGRRLW